MEGRRLEAGWKQAGSRLEAVWKQAGSRLEAGWKQVRRRQPEERSDLIALVSGGGEWKRGVRSGGALWRRALAALSNLGHIEVLSVANVAGAAHVLNSSWSDG